MLAAQTENCDLAIHALLTSGADPNIVDYNVSKMSLCVDFAKLLPTPGINQGTQSMSVQMCTSDPFISRGFCEKVVCENHFTFRHFWLQ